MVYIYVCVYVWVCPCIYIYIYIYIRDIQLKRWTFDFFKEINNGDSFRVLEDCQHNRLYWLLLLEGFLFFSSTFFSTQDHYSKPIFSLYVNIFFLKYTFLFAYSFVNFIWFAFFVQQKFDETRLFQTEALRFSAILDSLKTNICAWVK